jgi:hypothetical protein
MLALSLVCAIMAMLSPAAEGASFENTSTVYKDPSGDVIVDDGVRALETLSDLNSLPDRKASDSKERLSVDISRLTVLENDTYISYVLEMIGPVYARSEYHYILAGYARSEVKETDPFDFMIVVNNKTATYLTWTQGDFVQGSNVTGLDIRDHVLNVTMHRSRFILGNRDTPHLIIAIAYLDQGVGRERISDHLIADEDDDGDAFKLTDAQILGLQIGFIAFVFVALFVVYGIWSRKKGQAYSGGVCPKCESRLDPNINFCPSCGTLIRGPGSEPAGPEKAKDGVDASSSEE